jgi:5-methylcytosine-specific restriction protein A
MNPPRKATWKNRGKGPGGLNFCYCGCGREVIRPSRTTFEAKCYLEWAKRNDPHTIRRNVYDRDKGICALCGVDSEFQERQRNDIIKVWYWLARREAEGLLRLGELLDYSGKVSNVWGDCHLWATKRIDEDTERLGWDLGRHTWEADHIVPVAEGGGGCDLSGYRTLCLACHKAETAKLAARLAERRRLAKQPELAIA